MVWQQLINIIQKENQQATVLRRARPGRFTYLCLNFFGVSVSLCSPVRPSWCRKNGCEDELRGLSQEVREGLTEREDDMSSV